MISALPKFTQYQLSNLVEFKLKSDGLTIQEATKKYSINNEQLSDILGKKVRFKITHYEITSKITGISIDELLSDEEIHPISFRSKHDGGESESINEIQKITEFFKEVALLKKLNGEIGTKKEWLV